MDKDKKGWEERFDERFRTFDGKLVKLHRRGTNWFMGSSVKGGDIKVFIRANFVSRSELLEKVEGLRKPYEEISSDAEEIATQHYNTALNDIKALLGKVS